MNLASVAAGVLPAVEGGVSPPGILPGSWSVGMAPARMELSMNLGSLLNLNLNLLLNLPSTSPGSWSVSMAPTPTPPPLPGIPTGFRPKARGWAALRAYPG